MGTWQLYFFKSSDGALAYPYSVQRCGSRARMTHEIKIAIFFLTDLNVTKSDRD